MSEIKYVINMFLTLLIFKICKTFLNQQFLAEFNFVGTLKNTSPKELNGQVLTQFSMTQEKETLIDIIGAAKQRKTL